MLLLIISIILKSINYIQYENFLMVLLMKSSNCIINLFLLLRLYFNFILKIISAECKLNLRDIRLKIRIFSIVSIVGALLDNKIIDENKTIIFTMMILEYLSNQ